MLDTIRDAKLYIVRNWEDGVRCPCCNQNVKLYKRKFNKAMAICLIELFRLTQGDTTKYMHIRELQEKSKIFMHNMNGGNFATMKYWNVIDSQPNDDDKKRTSGLWRITNLGRNFVMGNIKISSHIYTYNMTLKRIDPNEITISESLKRPFNYRELMNND